MITPRVRSGCRLLYAGPKAADLFSRLKRATRRGNARMQKKAVREIVRQDMLRAML